MIDEAENQKSKIKNQKSFLSLQGNFDYIH